MVELYKYRGLSEKTVRKKAGQLIHNYSHLSLCRSIDSIRHRLFYPVTKGNRPGHELVGYLSGCHFDFCKRLINLCPLFGD